MGNEINELEKTVVELKTRLEVLTENLTNAILRLEKKLDELSQNFVTKDVLEEKLKNVYREIETLKEDKKTNKQLFPSWIGNLIAVGAVIVAIVAIFHK